MADSDKNNIYQNLIVWQKAMDLVEEMYRLIRTLPKEEMFAIADQMRRASVSVPSNIAEGAGRKTAPDFIHFLVVARGSVYEIETQLRICIRLGYFKENQAKMAFGLCKEIGKMLSALVSNLESKCDKLSSDI